MKTTRKISIFCIAALYAVTLALNVHGSFCCIEDSGNAMMELACNPCGGIDENKCSSGDPINADGDHACCEYCSDVTLEEIGLSQTLSTKRLTGGFGITVLSISPGIFSTFCVMGERSLGPPEILFGLVVAQASLEVLRC